MPGSSRAIVRGAMLSPTQEEKIMPLTLTLTDGILPKGQEKVAYKRLAEAMLRLARDDSLRRSMGAAGRAKAIAQYDWQRKIDQILRVYSETVARSRTSK